MGITLLGYKLAGIYNLSYIFSLPQLQWSGNPRFAFVNFYLDHPEKEMLQEAMYCLGLDLVNRHPWSQSELLQGGNGTPMKPA